MGYPRAKSANSILRTKTSSSTDYNIYPYVRKGPSRLALCPRRLGRNGEFGDEEQPGYDTRHEPVISPVTSSRRSKPAGAGSAAQGGAEMSLLKFFMTSGNETATRTPCLIRWWRKYGYFAGGCL